MNIFFHYSLCRSNKCIGSKQRTFHDNIIDDSDDEVPELDPDQVDLSLDGNGFLDPGAWRNHAMAFEAHGDEVGLDDPDDDEGGSEVF